MDKTTDSVLQDTWRKLAEAFEKGHREREESIKNFKAYGKDKLSELGWNPTGYVYKYADVEEYRLDNCDTRLFIGIEKDKRMNILSPGEKYLTTYGYVNYDELDEFTKLLRNIQEIKNNPEKYTVKELNDAESAKKKFLKKNQNKNFPK